MLKKTHIRNDEREELMRYHRKLTSLYTHALGQTGPCRELFDAGRVAKLIDERLHPPPLIDLVAEAKAVIERFGRAECTQNALAEAEEG